MAGRLKQVIRQPRRVDASSQCPAPQDVEHRWSSGQRVDLPGADELYAAVEQVVDGEVPVASELVVNAQAGLECRRD